MMHLTDHVDPADPLNAFVFRGSDSIHDQAHCGIINGLLAPGIRHRTLGCIDGLWAPPFVSTDFRFSVSVNDQPLPCRESLWWPFKIEQWSRAGGFSVSSTTVLVPGKRAGLMHLRISNPGRDTRTVPVRCTVSGTLARDATWTFLPPVSTQATVAEISGTTLALRRDDHAIVVQADGSAANPWSAATPNTGLWHFTIAPGETVTLNLAFAMGPHATALAECAAVLGNPQLTVSAADENHRAQVRNIYARLPRLTSSNPELDRWYHRSLVHLIMNRWEVPEFALNPYYGTGSVRGGCICCYLWNYGELWELLPLFEPAAHRAHIEQFLRVNMANHLAWGPLDGAGVGPWYPVNQEKIVGLIYHHVLLTGDRAFLHQQINGRSVLEHAVAHATLGDDASAPVDLIDYGPANDHLELRRHIHYHHVMPDLNARRYQLYMWAAELSALTGTPRPDLVQRATELKAVIKERLWNRDLRWLEGRTPAGRDVRYTNQMFKLFSSDVLDDEMEAGLLDQLRHGGFLSEYGLHSLATHDPAYDPNDVDNGGPGSCTSFPPQIAERLYKAGHPGPAADLIRRTLWWAGSVPYWSDSMAAETKDYRRDTSLQCMVDGAAIAQSVIFGVFGVRVIGDGTLIVAPQPSGLAERMALRGLRVQGRCFDIVADGAEFQVSDGTQTWTAHCGETLRIPAGK